MERSAKYDFRFQRGTFGVRAGKSVSLKNEYGDPVSMFDATVTLSASFRDARITRSSDDGSLQMNHEDSSISFELTKDEVFSIPPGRMMPYQIEILYEDGSGFRLLEGYFICTGIALGG